jgi:class 3 adenylate cyclase
MKMMAKPAKTAEELIQRSITRLKKSTKQGFRYTHLDNATSNNQLREYISKRIPLYVIFVDLVDSTKMSQKIPPSQLGDVIRSFSQESTIIIENYNGHILKFVGDAVVAYFIPKNGSKKIANDVIKCAQTIIDAAKMSANTILEENHLPPLHLHIGIDFGLCSVLLYGTDKKKSHIDLIGNTINMAAKMQAAAEVDEIIIGKKIHEKLEDQRDWKKIIDKNIWKYDYAVFSKLNNDRKSLFENRIRVDHG